MRNKPTICQTVPAVQSRFEQRPCFLHQRSQTFPYHFCCAVDDWARNAGPHTRLKGGLGVIGHRSERPAGCVFGVDLVGCALIGVWMCFWRKSCELCSDWSGATCRFAFQRGAALTEGRACTILKAREWRAVSWLDVLCFPEEPDR